MTHSMEMATLDTELELGEYRALLLAQPLPSPESWDIPPSCTVNGRCSLCKSSRPAALVAAPLTLYTRDHLVWRGIFGCLAGGRLGWPLLALDMRGMRAHVVMRVRPLSLRTGTRMTHVAANVPGTAAAAAALTATAATAPPSAGAAAAAATARLRWCHTSWCHTAMCTTPAAAPSSSSSPGPAAPWASSSFGQRVLDLASEGIAMPRVTCLKGSGLPELLEFVVELLLESAIFSSGLAHLLLQTF